MRIIKGFKIGGLQQKIFNLTLLLLIALVAAYVALNGYQRRYLTETVRQANEEQQSSIETVSEETMETVLQRSMSRSAALQAYIADDLFADVRADVLTLQAVATQIFAREELYSPRSVEPPSADNDGVPSVQLIHEAEVDPERSQLLGLAANLSEFMLAMYENSDKMSSCFIGTADGNMVLVNDRPGVFLMEDGTPLPLNIRERPWYLQAAAAGELTFTDVEIDAYTENRMLECAAPVYRNGELVAVVAADIYLTAINDYVEAEASDSDFVCVINEAGQVLFAPSRNECFQVVRGAEAPDLRKSENAELAQFVTEAMRGTTDLHAVTVNGKGYYMLGAPMPNIGWTVVSVTSREMAHKPSERMLARYDEINRDALAAYAEGTARYAKGFISVTALLLLLATAGTLALTGRIVGPLEQMTKRINALHNGDTVFEMEDAYRTGDEIEVLAESFATMSKRTRDYITQITSITAEKQRIATELGTAANIQANMLPNLFPAFPKRSEFDLYATMHPAKEVGGDFYDFFLIDSDHLALVVADVSGKGVPAALFMMTARTIIKTKAQSNAAMSPKELLMDANAALTENNKEGMFVTVWFGVLEISTGKLTYADAGHEKLLLYQNGAWRFLPKTTCGPALAMWEPDDFELADDKYQYCDETIQLKPGDAIFQYTDGVTEATDANNELFGDDRVLEAMNSAPSADPEELLPHMREKIDEFVKDAPQFDDITMLGLRYLGA